MSGGPRPALSVVIPTRDTRSLTLRCLESLHEYAVPRMEIVLVDDAGTDGTVETVRRRFPAVRILRNPTPGGFTVSANRGLAEARGDLDLLLNSDTEVGQGSLPALLAAFGDRRLGVVGARLSYPDGRDQWSGGSRPGPLWLFVQASGFAASLSRSHAYRWLRRRIRGRRRGSLLPVDWVTGAALGLRRQVLEEVGPLDERFSFYAQDLDLCARAADAGWLVALSQDFRVVHHHGASISQEGATLGAQRLEMLWTDLVIWAEKRGGARFARRAWRALSAGARLRIAARRLALPFRPQKRRAHDDETEVLQQALAALDRHGAERLGT